MTSKWRRARVVVELPVRASTLTERELARLVEKFLRNSRVIAEVDGAVGRLRVLQGGRWLASQTREWPRRIDVHSMAASAAEFGFRASERGENLQMMHRKLSQLMITGKGEKR